VAVKIPEFRIVIPGCAAETRNPLNHFNSCIQPVQWTGSLNRSWMTKDKLLL